VKCLTFTGLHVVDNLLGRENNILCNIPDKNFSLWKMQSISLVRVVSPSTLYVWFLVDFQVFVVWVEQVLNHFIVNFHVGHSQ
jgi:hypothetical protein